MPALSIRGAVKSACTLYLRGCQKCLHSLFKVLSKVPVLQGCSVHFFGSKGSIKFVKVLEPSNCLSSSMCNFENGGFCWFLRSYSSKTCLFCLEYIKYIMFTRTQKTRTFDGHLRLFPAFLTTILDPIIRKKGLKFDERLIALEQHF